MAIVIDGTGSITGLSAGGLPDASITAAELASTLDLTGKTVTLPAGTGGKVLQVQTTVKTDGFSTTQTGATQVEVTGLSVSITPSSTSSKILLTLSITWGSSATDAMLRVYRGGTAIGFGSHGTGYNAPLVTNGNTPTKYRPDTGTVILLDSPNTTSSVTYSVKVYSPSGVSQTIRVCGRGEDGYFGTTSSITAMEIAA